MSEVAGVFGVEVWVEVELMGYIWGMFVKLSS